MNQELLERMLKSKDYHARAAAVRVLSYWHPRVDNATALLDAAIGDKSAMVRAEAVRAASFYPPEEVAESVLNVLEQETDEQLEYLLDETMKVIEGTN
jgi:hypothetical protein